MKTKISNCCGAEIFNTDTDFCPDCKDHCAIEEVEEETLETDGSIMGQLGGIVEATEELKAMMK